jgi:predicted nucleic acid-binding protein
VRKYVLDANALLGLLAGRPGASRVQKLLVEAGRQGALVYISAVDWGEAVYAMWQMRGEDEARKLIKEAALMPLAILPVDQERATRAGELKAVHGLGYADCFAAELAMELGATLTTADPEFRKLGKKLKVDYLPGHENSARK